MGRRTSARRWGRSCPGSSSARPASQAPRPILECCSSRSPLHLKAASDDLDQKGANPVLRASRGFQPSKHRETPDSADAPRALASMSMTGSDTRFVAECLWIDDGDEI